MVTMKKKVVSKIILALLLGGILTFAFKMDFGIAQGTVEFVDSDQSLGTSYSENVALGDLDDDGDLDAFVANSIGQPNKVWLNVTDLYPPNIVVLSPENKTYSADSVPLNFTVDETTSWMGYSLDGQANVTTAVNTTLSSLLDGMHHVVVYANDTTGNMGASSTVYFTVDTTPPNITEVSQTPLENNVLPEDEVEVNATVTDDLSGVKQVTLNYTNGNGTWIIVDMTNLEGNFWNATIPAFPYCTNVTYAIIAEDNANNTITTGEMGYEYKYHVIPELPSFIILPLFILFTLIAVALAKKIRCKVTKTTLTPFFC